MIHLKDFDSIAIADSLKDYNDGSVLVCKCRGSEIFTISDPNLMVFYPKFIVAFSRIYKCVELDDFEIFFAVPDDFSEFCYFYPAHDIESDCLEF